MRVVHKYPLDSSAVGKDGQKIPMPFAANVVLVAVQENNIVVWAEHTVAEGKQPIKERVFKIIGTGQTIEDDSLTHVGSVQRNGYVWHVYQQHY